MDTEPDTFLAGLTRTKVLAVIRGTDGDAAAATALALVDEGVDHVEIALTTPGALRAIRRVRDALPEGALLGAGTVLSAEDVAAVQDAGAQFVVTPAVVPAIEEAARRGLPVAAGALTPTEAHLARLMGASAVKLFPASVGGPAYLKAVRDPFPDIPFLAVGGVGLDDVVPYLRVGALGVGVGGPLVGDAASGGDLDALRRRARAYLEVAASA